MSYQLWIKDEAKAEIKRLPGHMRQRVYRAAQELSGEPRPSYSREMRRPEGISLEVRRLRLDQWRVIYVVDEEHAEVGVVAVRKRPPYNYTDLSELLDDLKDE